LLCDNSITNKIRKMKYYRIFIPFILAALMLVGISRCCQFPVKKGITLPSKTDCVTKTWKVENYKINGTDFTSLLASYTETYSKEGDYFYQQADLGGTGTWSFQNNDAEIRIAGINNQTSRTLFIQKLEETKFWYYYMDGGNKKECHFIK